MNWIDQASGTFNWFHAIYFIDKNNGWAVGDLGTILKTSTGGITFMEGRKIDLPSGYVLFQNYPNPFNPESVISYQLPVAGHVSLKVYDLLGREITTLVDQFQSAGTYNSKFNILHYQLPSGVYFYRLLTDNFVSTKKMILIK